MRDVFIHRLQVQAADIDLNQHANNVEFIRWMQDAAMAHATAQGWSAQRLLQAGCSWVVRSHHIDYLRPARLGDELCACTWIAGFETFQSPRATLFVRAADRVVLARARTQWVFVNSHSGRPARIPEGFCQAFDVVPAGEALALQRLYGQPT